MTCLECGDDRLVPSEVHLAGTRQGESYTVALQGLRCENCGFQTIDSTQSAEFTQLLSDAFRDAHNLLTGSEIRERRSQLGMTQQAFATYLGVGVASIKRWEIGQIQERAMDELIRVKTEADAALKNLKNIEQHIPTHCVLSNTVIAGQNVELSVLLPPQWSEKHPPIRLVGSICSLLEDDHEIVLAA